MLNFILSTCVVQILVRSEASHLLLINKVLDFVNDLLFKKLLP